MLQAAPITMPNFGFQVGRDSYTWEFHIQPNGVDGSIYTTDYLGYNRFSSHFPYGATIYYDQGSIDALGRMTWNPPPGFYNTAHHVVFQADFQNEVRRIFIDGVLVASALGLPNAYPQAGNSGPDNLYLTYAQGGMGEVRYWNYIRTPEQINETRNVALSGPQPGLVACWRCDERGAPGTQILDRSGNNFHGFIS
jgi:hypothetical protein